MAWTRAQLALAVGGLLMLIGTFLNFVTVKGPGGEQSFTAGDAEEASPYYIAAVMAIIAAIVLYAVKSATARKATLIIALVIIGFFGLYAAIVDITSIGDLVDGIAEAEASAGIGLYLSLIGAIAAIVGAVLGLKETPPTTTGPPAAAPPTTPGA